MCEELKALQAQTDSELREERSRRCSLLQEEVQGAAFSIQQLLMKLQQAEDKVQVRLSDLDLQNHPAGTRSNIISVLASECREAAAGEGSAPSSWQALLTQRGHPAATD